MSAACLGFSGLNSGVRFGLTPPMVHMVKARKDPMSCTPSGLVESKRVGVVPVLKAGEENERLVSLHCCADSQGRWKVVNESLEAASCVASTVSLFPLNPRVGMLNKQLLVVLIQLTPGTEVAP